MKKKVLSAVLALTLVFGSAAALPQGFITESSSISVSAATYGSYQYSALSDGTVQITGYNGTEKSLVIPSTINGKTVSKIAHSAFIMSNTLESVTFPDTVTEIGETSFLYCPQLTAVNFGKNLKKIGKNAFKQCKSLTSVTIPASVTQISEYAFSECVSLKTVTIRSGASATVDNYAFQDCSALTTVNFGNTISAIGTSSFEGCKALTSVTIPGSVNSISQAAFKDCISLKTLSLGNGVKTIASNAFMNCKALNSVTFGASLETIGDSAFEDCTSLTRIVLMPSTTTIGTSAFAGCSALTTAILSGVEVIGPKAFSYCPKLSTVDFCEKLRAVGEDAFINCGNYTSIYIPADELNEIQEHAFGCVYDSSKNRYGTDPSCTIYSSFGSVAERYAGKFSVKFTVLDSTHKCLNVAVVVPATCKAEGYTAHICKYCGKTTTSDTTPKKSHTGENWRTTAYDTKAKTSTQTGNCADCGATVTKTTQKAITRLAGEQPYANRYGTAVAISKTESSAVNVVLANGTNFADALAGVPFAFEKKAPILLTSKDIIDAGTIAEINRLGAKNVYILGGVGAVSDKVVTAIKQKCTKVTNVERVFGNSRFGTATAIAKKLNFPTEVFFVCSDNFADALSIGSVAARKGAPIIYLTKNGALNPDTEAYLKDMKGKIGTAYVIGGTGVISDEMAAKAAKACGRSTYTRIAGANRYETCTSVNTTFKSLLTADGICIAKGSTFPDALAGGVYSAKTAQPLFLADGKYLIDCQKSYLKTKNPAKLTAFGGTGAVTDELIGVIAKASI